MSEAVQTFNSFDRGRPFCNVGPSRLVQVMLPLVRRARGRIVLASSILTHVAAPVRGVHAASLAALDAMAACLRRELKPRGVDVVSHNPYI